MTRPATPVSSWAVTWRDIIVPLLAPAPSPHKDPRTKPDREYLRGRWHEVTSHLSAG